MANNVRGPTAAKFIGRRLAILSLGIVCLASIARGDGPTPAPAAIPTQERLPLGAPSPRAGATGEPVKTPASLAGSSLQVALALTVVVGVIVVAGMAVRKVASKSGGLFAAMGPGGRAPSGVLEVLGRFPLGRGCMLVLLKLDRRVLLVSMGRGGMSTLSEVTDPDEVASILLRTRDEAGESIARQFAGLLQREDENAGKALRGGAARQRAVDPRTRLEVRA